jgi:phage-related protein
MSVTVRHLWDGQDFTLYALEYGEDDDFSTFSRAMRRDRPKEMATMIARLVRLADQGITSKAQNFNDLGGGLWEAKTSGGLRVTFFRHGAGVFILNSGFAKKSQKAKAADLERARARRLFFEEALRGGAAVTVLVDSGVQPRRSLL